MVRILICIALAAFAAPLVGCGGGSQAPLPPNNTVSQAGAGKYIVVLKPGSTLADVGSLSQTLGTRPEHSYGHAIVGFAGLLTPAEQAQLKADPRVDFIEPDLPVWISKGKPPGSPGGVLETHLPRRKTRGVTTGLMLTSTAATVAVA